MNRCVRSVTPYRGLTASRITIFILLAPLSLLAQTPAAPLFNVLDLDRGKPAEVILQNGGSARVELMDRTETRDRVRGAVRNSRLRVRVNGQEVSLDCANHRLPVTVAGVHVDCEVTKGLLDNSRSDPWGLVKEARLRSGRRAPRGCLPGVTSTR